MSHQDTADLRVVALDDATTPRTRLSAIDVLASMSNTYGTMVNPITGYIEPSVRAKKFISKALRKLRKTKRPMSRRMLSSIAQRLLLLRGIALNINNPYLTPPLGADGKFVDLTPPKRIEKQPVAQPTVAKPVNPRVAELEAFLAQHGG